MDAKAQQLHGMRIRDEFLCPITFELMRDPVVAMDGHTYERTSIEYWVRTNRGLNNMTKSPRTGELMGTTLIENINLRKLIQDCIQEGGVGLYAKDVSNANRLIEVRPELTVVITCLGPVESEWNNRTFQVCSNGCIGGRGSFTDEVRGGREVMQFKELDVSRKHFEIVLDDRNHRFGIRDLGSVGGTFIRIPYGQSMELHPGMILLMGQHQFTVSSIVDHRDNPSILENAEEIINQYSAEESNNGMLQQQLEMLTNMIKMKMNEKTTLSANRDGERGGASGGNHNRSRRNRIMTLTCFQPEGSPILGHNFVITSEGGILGRKASCAVPICAQPSASSSSSRCIDSAISSEHARIEMNPETGQFFIFDGTATKASTNGVWWRLSGPQQQSSLHPLTRNTEFIIGKSRFQVKESVTLVEKELPAAVSAAADAK